MQAAYHPLPEEADDITPDAQLSSAPQGAQNILAQLPAPGTQQPSGMVPNMPDGRMVNQQKPGAPAMMQPVMVQGQVPGQMMYLPTAQPQQMWPSMQMPYPVNDNFYTCILAQAYSYCLFSQAPALQPTGPVIVPGTGVDLCPPSYIIMSLIITFICFFLNVTTLILGIPAIILSILVSSEDTY